LFLRFQYIYSFKYKAVTTDSVRLIDYEKEKGGSTIYRYWESFPGLPDPVEARTSPAIPKDCKTSVKDGRLIETMILYSILE